jgi:methylenetetrahydrofolate dehydrogenase (NADP+)/methenyltetrahydrofolate cyclohydrolase
MVSESAVVVDVGLSRIEDKLVGDISPTLYKKVSAYSPVPGGIGPMTRAMLLSNVVRLAKKSAN